MSFPATRLAAAPDLTSLVQLADELFSIDDPTALLTTFCQRLRTSLTADVALFYRPADGGPLIGRPLPAEDENSTEVIAGADTLVAQAALQRAPCRTNGLNAAFRPVTSGVPRGKVRSALAFPLDDNSGSTRVIQLLRLGEPPFAEDEAHWCTAAAALAGARLSVLRSAAEQQERISARTALLKSANDQLQETGRRQEAFIAAMIADLSPPLANLNQHLLLLEAAAPEKTADIAAALQRDAARLQRLADRLLAHSREALAENRLALHALDVNEIVAEAIRQQRSHADRLGRKLLFLPALNLPPIAGSDTQLAAAFTDIAAYAIATSSGSRVEVRTLGDNEGQIRVTVRFDRGSGNHQTPRRDESAARRRHIEASAVPRQSLRLATAREIFQLHAGTMTSIDGQNGERLFEITLPAAAIHLPHQPPFARESER